MSWSSQFKNVLVAVSLAALGAPEAGAIEIYSGANAAAHMDDGLLTQARAGRGGGGVHRGGAHRGMHGGAHRGAYAGARHGNVHRGNVNRGNVNRGNV
ncbi:MAG TPA: hypothetical protein VMI72_11325, partial [Roseiarcus sp.]|nr:hypothetical protein [Roseiarcus sp.]